MKTPHEFYLETDGKIIDVDHEYGGQCWDLFALFCLEYCNKTFSCIETGYVIDLWTHFDEVGLGEYFERVYNWKDLQDGDWLIWQGPCMITNSSHIAMFRIDEPNTGGGTFLTQNPDGDPKYTHQMWISYNNYVGALRPKCYITQDKTLPNPVEENKEVDQFKVNCNDTMNVRLDHKKSGESIGFAREGFYNILNRCDDDGYAWFEVEKNKWIALLPPYDEFIPKTQETPQNQEKDQNSINIPQNKPKNDENDPYEIIPINQDKENPLVEFIKWIIKLIQNRWRKKK